MGAELKYPRIIRAVVSTPWAILPERLVDIMDVLAFQAAGGKLTAAEVRELIGERAITVEGGPAVRVPASVDAAVAAAVPGAEPAPRSQLAVIRMHGIMANRIEAMDELSGPGGVSVERTQQRLADAVNDPRVGGIFLDIDSPGGAVEGVPELAAAIDEATTVKPVWAHANTTAASAAYWIGSQADELSVTPSGEVGSIGVFAAHSDLSEKLAAAGERVTLVHAGRYKVTGNPFEPLDDEGRELIQARVDEVYGMFVEAVASGRGVSEGRVREGYGEGRVVSAAEALQLGMVDRVETRDEALGRLRAEVAGRPVEGTQRAAGHSPHEFAFV